MPISETKTHPVLPLAAGALTGLCAGAGLMYLFDPARGHSRRAKLRDEAAAAWRQGREEVTGAITDLGNRARGLAAEIESKVACSGEEVPDGKLVGRVRAKLGRSAPHARVHALEVNAHEGVVTVAGPVREEEAPAIVAAVRSIPGVRAIDDRMARYRTLDKPLLGGTLGWRVASLLGGGVLGYLGLKR